MSIFLITDFVRRSISLGFLVVEALMRFISSFFMMFV